MTTQNQEIMDAMEQAAISGLCRDGQLEIGQQIARTLYPELSEAALLAIAEGVYKRAQEQDHHS
ncbi:MAG: hypothetical protein OQL20_04545 [Sedimenticola sp.]|nr:hypothetical protein [Sedimenticola sp.]